MITSGFIIDGIDKITNIDFISCNGANFSVDYHSIEIVDTMIDKLKSHMQYLHIDKIYNYDDSIQVLLRDLFFNIRSI